jgi:hypothetical protein
MLILLVDRPVLISLPIYTGLVPEHGANHTTPNEYRAFLCITCWMQNEEIREVNNNSWTFYLKNKKEIRKLINNSWRVNSKNKESK